MGRKAIGSLIQFKDSLAAENVYEKQQKNTQKGLVAKNEQKAFLTQVLFFVPKKK